MEIGLFCLMSGLFMADAFKDALWPKALAIGGLGIVVGLVANVVMWRFRPSSGD